MPELADALTDLGVPVTQVDVTSGASPVEITVPSGVGRLIVNVTTGGTAGVEVLNLPALTGLINVGLNVIVVLDAKTDPGDSVQVTVDGESAVYFYTSSLYGGTDPLVLSDADAAAGFVWCYDSWYCDPTLTDWNFDTTPTNPTLPLVIQAQAAGQSIEIDGRSSNAADMPGGDVILGLGAGDGAGRNGTVLITGPGLPMSDPGVPGALFYDPPTATVKYSPIIPYSP